MIEKIIPGNKIKLRIVREIYENRGINITSLIKKTRGSPNFVLKYINELSENNIIKEERKEKKKKIHVRNLEADFDNELARIIYSIVELEKKDLFLEKYKSISNYFLELEESLKEGFVLIYGSYARFAVTKDSDIDILIVGNLKKEDVNRIKEIFVTFDKEVSLKIETFENFIKNIEKPLYQNILKEHIVAVGVEEFIKTINKIKKRFKLLF